MVVCGFLKNIIFRDHISSIALGTFSDLFNYVLGKTPMG